MKEILLLISSSGANSVTVNGQLVRMLVDEQLKDPIHKIYLDQIISFADPVDRVLRDRTREVFGARISNRYSCEEFGYLAISCWGHDHLHALQFHNYLEIVNDQGLPCEVGEIGRVLVTSLTNPGMPLIRYELGDYASWQEPCQSGLSLPVISPEITRIRDGLTDVNGVSFVPTTGKAKFLDYSEIRDFQLYLFDDVIVGLFAVRSELANFQLEQIRLDLAKMFHSTLPVKIVTTDSLSWLGSWKRRLYFKIPLPSPKDIDAATLKTLTPMIQPGAES